MSRLVKVENGYGVHNGKLIRLDFCQPYENQQSESVHGHYVGLVELDDGSLIECVATNITFLDAQKSEKEWLPIDIPQTAQKSHDAGIVYCESCGIDMEKCSTVQCKNQDHLPF